MIGKRVVLVYRPEACAHLPPNPLHSDPFDGIELAGIVDTDEEADVLIDRLKARKTLLTAAGWAFLVEPIPATMETVS